MNAEATISLDTSELIRAIGNADRVFELLALIADNKKAMEAIVPHHENIILIQSALRVREDLIAALIEAL